MNQLNLKQKHQLSKKGHTIIRTLTKHNFQTT